MDGIPGPPASEPTVQIIQKSFFQTKKGMVIVTISLGLVIFLIIFALSLNLPFFSKRPQTDLSDFPLKIVLSENYGLKVGDLTMDCPVESAFCPSQKLVKFNKNDAISYQTGSGSNVLHLVKVLNLDNIAVREDRKLGKKYFYESVVSKDNKSCYTIAYTLPQDATFTNILNLEFLDQNKPFATVGTQTFEIEGEQVNVLIQIRNTPMDSGVPCSLIQKNPEFFKNF